MHAALVQDKLKALALELRVFITDAHYYSQMNGPCPFSDRYCCNISLSGPRSICDRHETSGTAESEQL